MTATDLVDFNKLKKDIQTLPIYIAKQLNIQTNTFKFLSNELEKQLEKSTNIEEKTELQIKYIFTQFLIISNIQNGGDKGFLPDLAKEVKGIDCTLSSWCLWYMLKSISDLKVQFAYPSGHSANIITLANNKVIYADAQNGIAYYIETKQVFDENNLDTAYPIFEVIMSNRISINIEGLGQIDKVRKEGSYYLPKYFGIKNDNELNTLSNVFMLTSIDSPVFFTKCAGDFRLKIGIKELPIQLKNKIKNIKTLEDTSITIEERKTVVKFIEECNTTYKNIVEPIVEKEANGKVIQETKFQKLHLEQHNNYLSVQSKK